MNLQRAFPIVMAAVLVTAFLAAALVLGMDAVRSRPVLALMGAVLLEAKELGLLTTAVLLMTVALVVEWNAIANHSRIMHFSLAKVEAKHPRLPGQAEIISTVILSLALALLCTLLVETVYAMAYLLHETTLESKATQRVLMADFDNDGDLDYVAGNADGGSNLMDLYLNDGAGNYAHSTFARSSQFKDFAAGDIDGDGDVDIVAVFNTNCTRNYVNNGSASFTDSMTGSECSSIGSSSDVLRLSDVDGDGDLDRVIMSNTYVTQNAVELNNGNGSFTGAPSILPTGWAMTMADFDSDGDQDLVFTQPNGHTMEMYKNSGTGSFTSFSSVSILTTPYNKDVQSADVDGDGDIDVVLAGEDGQIYIVTNNGAGTFSAGAALAGSSNERTLALADVDNDGDIDIVSGASDSSLNTYGGTRIWLNTGAGTFTDSGTPSTERSDCVNGIAIGDIDNDGDADYVSGNDSTNCFLTTGGVNRVYTSDQAATVANTAPNAPTANFSVSGTVNAIAYAPVSGIMGQNDTTIGTVAWNNVANVGSSDNLYASVDLTGVAFSNYLKVSSFPFSIPNGVTISGIVVEFEKRASTPATNIHDKSVRLIKNATTYVGTDKATATDWPTAVDTFVSYGGATDLWGTTWTPTDVNSGFNVAIAADKTVGAGTTTGYIDSARVTVYYASGANVTLSWGSGSDVHTPTRLLQYQTRVGTVSLGNNIISGKTASPNYADRMMPNGQSRQRLVKRMDCGTTYYWGVKTVDSGLKTSAESSEQTFSIGSDCSVGNPPLLYGYAGNGSGGGGGAAWLQNLLQQQNGAGGPTGTIAGQLFVDVNGNGKKESGERGGFAGVRVEAAGKDIAGADVTKVVVADSGGKFQMTVPAGTYNVSAVDPSGILHGYQATVGSSDVTVDAGEVVTVGFGWKSEKLLGYKPCLTIGEVNLDTGKPVSQAILLGIKNLYGKTVVQNGALAEPLVSRKEFIELLAGTQCLSLTKSGDALREDLRAAARKNGWLSGVLSDVAVPETLVGGSSWGNSAYALLAQGVPAGRAVGETLVADGNAPVTKREAMTMVAAMLGVKSEGELLLSLPPDANTDDATSGTFVALKKAGVLPRGFEASIGGGVIPSEAADLLVKAAFAGGKLTLSALPDEVRWDQGAEAEYLGLAGIIDRRPCLVQDTARATAVRADILPNAAGDLFQRLQLLLSVGTNDQDGRTRWLITGRPSEYGVKAGNIGLSANKAVTWVGLVDVGMKLTCHPLETFQQATRRVNGGGVELGNGGTANMIFAPDRVFGTEDGVTYVQRLLHSFQRPIREFDLTPMAFAQDLTLEEQKDFSAPVSQSDASRLLASYVLYTRVKTGAMTRLEAEGAYSQLQTSILQELTGVPDDEMWRMASVGQGKPLTWGELITVASDVLGPELKDTPLPDLSTGEAWWNVVSH